MRANWMIPWQIMIMKLMTRYFGKLLDYAIPLTSKSYYVYFRFHVRILHEYLRFYVQILGVS